MSACFLTWLLVNYTSTQCDPSSQLTCGHLQVGTSRWLSSSCGLVWNGKRAGTTAKMLCVGEITPGERTVKGSKSQSHVESWRRGEDHTEEWSGEKEEA